MDASAWLLGLALRSTLVLAVALGLERLLRRKPAGARHLVLTLAAVGLLLTPALSALLPRWPLPLVPRWVGPTARTVVLSGVPPVAVEPLARPEPSRRRRPASCRIASRHAPVARAGESEVALSVGSVLFAVWLLGGAAALAGTGARAAQRGAASGHDASAFGALARHRRADVPRRRSVPDGTAAHVRRHRDAAHQPLAEPRRAAADGGRRLARRASARRRPARARAPRARRRVAAARVAPGRGRLLVPPAGAAGRAPRPPRRRAGVRRGRASPRHASLRLRPPPDRDRRVAARRAAALRGRAADGRPWPARKETAHDPGCQPQRRTRPRRGGDRLRRPGRDRPRGLGRRSATGRGERREAGGGADAGGARGARRCRPLRLHRRDGTAATAAFQERDGDGGTSTFALQRAPRRRPKALRAGAWPGELRREGRLDSRARSWQLRADRDGHGPALAADADHAGGRRAAATSGG